MYTSGLLILTNDGGFANKLMHPKHEIEKTYRVQIKGKIDKEDILKLERGVDIGDYITRPSKVREIYIDDENKSVITITISEGKNRQVRKMIDAIGYKVIGLKRISIGNLKLDDLQSGKWRYLRESEIKQWMKD